MFNLINERFFQYVYLMRLNKPIGILLLLWPTLWALWISANGIPNIKILIIFGLGVVIMRSAGCVINDLADCNFDGYVKRTRERPLVTGKVSKKEAQMLFLVLCADAFALVLLLNVYTIFLSFIGLALAIIYPFMKRYIHLPQAVLGCAFAWSVPMAFASQNNMLTKEVWLVFAIAVLWPIMYDTLYAMVDREDDLKIGIKSSAIFFGKWDLAAIAGMQVALIFLIVELGNILKLNIYFDIAVGIGILNFFYQLILARTRKSDLCFKAFMLNNWFGFIIFAGIFLAYFTR